MTVPPPYDPMPSEYGGPPWRGAPYEFPPYEFPGPYQHPGYPYGSYPPARTNALAIASLVCAFLFAPLAILFGHLSLSQIKRTGEEGRGMAIAGLVIGYIVTIGTILFMIAVFVLAAWAARLVQENPYAPGIHTVAPLPGQRTLPAFDPPAGLGSACSYPATATGATKPVKPPPGGEVSTDPPTIDAIVTTTGGPIDLELDNAQAPCTVNSFVSLARQGYFDDTPCHRLTTGRPMSVLQCGDPTGKGNGGPGYRFDNEYPTNQYRRLDPALQQTVVYPRGTLVVCHAIR